ncbi:hypothetical protein D3C86_1295830 [compost metagenome]
MVSTDDQTAGSTSQGILGDHTLTSLDVALVEVRYTAERFDHCVGCRLDVDGHNAVGLDRFERKLSFCLVALFAVWKTNRDEFCIVAISTKSIDRPLCEQTRC